MNDLILIPEDDAYDRTKYLGGSNAAAVMGLGAYGNTPLTCYLAKIGEGAEEIDPKRELFLQRRKRWEGPIIEMLREEFDAEIVGVNRRYRDREHAFLAAEIDFEWRDADGSIQNGEIKTVSPFAFGERDGWGEAGSADIPVHYAAQVMHGLGLTGRQTCIVAAMVGLDSMIFYRVERDDETIAALRDQMVRFWINNVLARVPPEPVSLADVMRLTLRMRGRPVDADESLLANLDSLAHIRGSMAAMDGEKDELMFKIGLSILKQWGIPAPALTDKGAIDPAQVGDNALILSAGKQVASWNLQSTTRVDSKRLREEAPEIFTKFSKTTPSRTLRFKKQK